MFSHLPLDDRLNRVFYIEGGLWRLVYAAAWGQCVLRREALHIDFDHAVALITAGELLWTPPDSFEHLGVGTSLDTVQQEHALLGAFLRSPAGRGIAGWELRTRLESRLNDDRAWLARRALALDDADEPDDAR
jgi:hypothetical protein